MAALGRAGMEYRALAIDAVVKHPLDEAGTKRVAVLVDCLEHVAGADAGALAGSVGGDLAGAKAAGSLDPPDAVGRRVVVGLGREVQPAKTHTATVTAASTSARIRV